MMWSSFLVTMHSLPVSDLHRAGSAPSSTPYPLTRALPFILTNNSSTICLSTSSQHAGGTALAAVALDLYRHKTPLLLAVIPHEHPEALENLRLYLSTPTTTTWRSMTPGTRPAWRTATIAAALSITPCKGSGWW